MNNLTRWNCYLKASWMVFINMKEPRNKEISLGWCFLEKGKWLSWKYAQIGLGWNDRFLEWPLWTFGCPVCLVSLDSRRGIGGWLCIVFPRRWREIWTFFYYYFYLLTLQILGTEFKFSMQRETTTLRVIFSYKFLKLCIPQQIFFFFW